MIVHDCKQGSGEWLTKRLGLPTASEFDALISPLWKIRTGEGPQTYLYGKLTEKLMGVPLDMGGSFHMENGTLLEMEARPWYGFTYDVEVRQVGFITTDDGRIGCSPDGILPDGSGLEIKCPAPQTHLKYLLEGVLPPQYRAQVHGSMFVTGAPHWTFVSYSRQFPALVLKIERDPVAQEAIGKALHGFLDDFDAKMSELSALKVASKPAAKEGNW